MSHNDNLTAFASCFKTMKESLLKWAFSKGGVINDGCMSGLSENDNTHFTVRNEQLEILSTYSASAESKILELETEIKRLKDRNILLETATREQLLSDEEVKSQCERLLKYRVDEETRILDFKDMLKNRLYYLNLGLKRGLIENNAIIQNKIEWCVFLLKYPNELKTIFDELKNELIHEDIKKNVPTPPKP